MTSEINEQSAVILPSAHSIRATRAVLYVCLTA
jgi:hypothetical protein